MSSPVHAPNSKNKLLKRLIHPGWASLTQALLLLVATLPIVPLRAGCLTVAVFVAAYTFHNTALVTKRVWLTSLVTVFLFVPLAIGAFLLGRYLDRKDWSNSNSGKEIVDYVKDQIPPQPDPAKILLRIDRFEFGLDDPQGPYTNVFLTYTGNRAIKPAVRYTVSIFDTKGRLIPNPEFREVEKRNWDALEVLLKKKESAYVTMPPKHPEYFSVIFTNASEQDYQALANGRFAMLSSGTFNYSDEYGEHQKEFCVWHYANQFLYCKDHNN